jgi:nucleoside-diphosphate-sugar epimerase
LSKVVVVTGASGSLGGAFCRAAVHEGYYVVACGRRPTRSVGVREVSISDIRDISVEDLPPRADCLVHFATGTSGGEDEIVATAVEGTRAAFNAAAGAQIKRFVHVSSMSVYPASARRAAELDGTDLEPHPERRGAYAHGKVLAEREIIDLLRDDDAQTMDVVVVRPGLVFGPETKNALGGVAVSLPLGICLGVGKPSQRVAALDIADLSQALLSIVSEEPQPGQRRIWDVISSTPRKEDLIEDYARLTGRARRRVWFPRVPAMGAALVLDVIGWVKGPRRHVLYKLRRAYDFDPGKLPFERLWQHTGVRPQVESAAILKSAMRADTHFLSAAEERRQRAEALLDTATSAAQCAAAGQFVIVGAGRVVEELHVPALSKIPAARVVGVVDRDLVRARIVADMFPGARAFSEVDEIKGLDWSDTTAVIATPGFTHGDLARQLIRAGAHVLIEKPASLYRDQFAALLAEQAGSSQVITVMQNYRFRRNALKLWSFLHDHDVGALLQARMIFRTGPLAGESTSWSRDEKRNRVLLFELGIHFLDLVAQVVGPLRKLQDVSVVDDRATGSTVSVGAHGVGDGGAQVWLELDIAASSQQTHLFLDFERSSCSLDFFPEGFRILPQRLNPVDDAAAAGARLGRLIQQRFFDSTPLGPRRAVPHGLIYRHHLSRLAGSARGESPFSLDGVSSTMGLLYELADHVYGRT